MSAHASGPVCTQSHAESQARGCLVAAAAPWAAWAARLTCLSSRFPRGAAGSEQTGGERKGQRAVRLMEMLSEKHLPVLT